MSATDPPASRHAPIDDGTSLPMPSRLAEFDLQRVLGIGGFGIVYLAHDTSLDRQVAIKEYMPAALASRRGTTEVVVRSERHRETFDAGLRSFVNEARLLAQFDHPALVRVFRFWEAHGTAYMVMPFIEGMTLKDRLRALPAPPDEDWLRALLDPLTEALQVLHARQCYHRDIAPDNIILLADSGRPLLLDFGAARQVIGDMTQALTVILKPGYAPLEQYAEVPQMRQGPWTDVYALAAVVYHAISGRTPPVAVARVMADSCTPLAELAAGRYGAGFLQAIDRALAVRPDHRTPDIATLRAELGLPARPSVDAGATRRLRADTPTTVPDAHRAALSWPATVSATATAAAITMATASATAATPATDTSGPIAFAPTAVWPRPHDDGPAEPRPPATEPPLDRPVAGVRRTAWILGGAGLLAVVGTGLWLGDRAGGAAGLGAGTVASASASASPASGLAPTPAPAPAPAPASVSAPPDTRPRSDTPSAAATKTAAPPTPAVDPPSTATPFDPAQAFAQVQAGAREDWRLQITPPAQALSIAHGDRLRFTLRSARDGYYHVLMRDADGSLALVLPNSRARGHRIRAGQVMALPPASSPLEAGEPTGTADILVLVSTLPRDYEALGGRRVSSFWQLPDATTLAGLAARHDPGQGPLLSARPADCTDARCSDYGAARFTLKVVR
ncbi:MAG: hypothetical protein RLY78_2025 [Pseudomonadota bacterium]